MKITILALSFLSLSAFANQASVFVGKYTVKSCPLYDLYSGDEYKRAYIKVTKDSEKNEVIELNLYGEEALIDHFLISSKARQAPGTDVDIHGEVTEQSTVNWLTPSDLEIKKYTKRPSIGFEMTSYSRFQLKDVKLTITSSYVGQDLQKCVLIKQ